MRNPRSSLSKILEISILLAGRPGFHFVDLLVSGSVGGGGPFEDGVPCAILLFQSVPVVPLVVEPSTLNISQR